VDEKMKINNCPRCNSEMVLSADGESGMSRYFEFEALDCSNTDCVWNLKYWLKAHETVENAKKKMIEQWNEGTNKVKEEV
jgi:hypothetical protein